MQSQQQGFINIRPDDDMYFGLRVGEFIICESDEDK